MSKYKVLFNNEDGKLIYDCMVDAFDKDQAIEKGSNKLANAAKYDKSIKVDVRYYPEVKKLNN